MYQYKWWPTVTILLRTTDLTTFAYVSSWLTICASMMKNRSNKYVWRWLSVTLVPICWLSLACFCKYLRHLPRLAAVYFTHDWWSSLNWNHNLLHMCQTTKRTQSTILINFAFWTEVWWLVFAQRFVLNTYSCNIGSTYHHMGQFAFKRIHLRDKKIARWRLPYVAVSHFDWVHMDPTYPNCSPYRL